MSTATEWRTSSPATVKAAISPDPPPGGLIWWQASHRPHQRHVDTAHDRCQHSGCPQNSLIADMNNDGHLDIVFSEQEQTAQDRVFIYYKVDGTGTTGELPGSFDRQRPQSVRRRHQRRRRVRHPQHSARALYRLQSGRSLHERTEGCFVELPQRMDRQRHRRDRFARIGRQHKWGQLDRNRRRSGHHRDFDPVQFRLRKHRLQARRSSRSRRN